MLFNVVSEASELFDLIGFRDGDQNWFIKPPSDQFDLATGHELAEAGEIFRTVFLDPEKQRTGVMETGADGGMLFQEIKKCEVGILIAFLKNMFEIAGWLMCMNDQNKVKGLTGL